MSEEKARFRIYRDPKTGNEFVFLAKGHVVIPGKDGWDSAADVVIQSMMWSLMMRVEVSKRNDGWLEADIEGDNVNFEHVPCDIGSRMLRHGHCTGCLIAGPAFDEATAAV